MSKIGRKPIQVPDNVQVEVLEGNLVRVKGPKGQLEKKLHPEVVIRKEDNQLIVEAYSESKFHRSLHGTTRTVLANMVEGVLNGFSKTLEIVGVGYRAALKGQDLEISVGYSKPVIFKKPDGVEFEVPNQTTIVVKGIDKELVGQVAANIRKIRKPEPYKGKGIRYKGEHVRKKAGKTGA